MSDMNHDRARKLLLAAAIEGIASGEREWLEGHLAACAECSIEARALGGAVESLKGFHITASPELIQKTMLAVRGRARQLDAARAASAPLWIAAAISSACMILTTPYVWWAFAWFGRITHIPDAFWQVGFLMWWFLPATLLAAAAVRRHSKDNVLNWGQR
jgi:hypothetical protein